MTRARTTNYPTNPNSNPIIRLHKFKIGLELDSSLRSYNVSITFFLLWFIKHKTNKFNRKIPTQALQIGRRKPTRSLGQKLWIMGYCRSWEGATRSPSVLTTTPTQTQNLLLHQTSCNLETPWSSICRCWPCESDLNLFPIDCILGFTDPSHDYAKQWQKSKRKSEFTGIQFSWLKACWRWFMEFIYNIKLKVYS